MSLDSPDADRYVLFGHPVAQSKSPFIHGLFARQLAQSMTYRLVDVGPGDFTATAQRFFIDGGAGANVTVPHKTAAVELADELTPEAERAGAVNTLAARDDGTLLGANTDGLGLLRDLETNLGLSLAGKRLLVLGAGGATRGILEPLLRARPAFLHIANRTPARAIELAAAFSDLGHVEGGGYADLADQSPFDLILNATAASLAGEVPPVPVRLFTRETVAYDLAYARGDTPFTQWARSRGMTQTHKGFGMLVEQAAAAFALWRGVRPETAPVLEALRSL
ncbi:MAG: shikimate dehydrogenase [Gammaproteobacteria bacterium]